MRRINHVLSFLVGILITQMPPIAQAGTDFVWDLDGRPLRTSSQYYILPAPNQKIGSGLILEGRNGSCPFNVAVSTRVSPGLPIIFSPAGASDKVIRLSADQNIRLFQAVTICVQSTVWRLGGLDEATDKRFVTTGGVTGNPGSSTVSNWFKVERESEGVDNGRYKLVFCPGVCSFCKVICGNLGVYNVNGRNWLALGDPALSIVFKEI
ncbi:LOW QUALITY PROTEIN: kunitz trypsin inhibitor 2 [Amborella trichopoda]|uniref:LOW QUALITY PROTEIN: kunitz trypsin inhibitor 2 n=1 Tax=Amborella trichopoda TaxID=13333 RepID=UPI0009BCC78A|nr:LOW QUALITY PROTEIN: kunitz trypsin inhibitor 2 [Amborella trichopoda]|eukprot:XP_011624804.2 LOW QUALITY PROTEIN: kunitz trypsin inhibitor 2 [Amborella trichopoda]